MNKVSIIAVSFALLSPAMLFASSDDWSWGLSQQGTSQQAGAGMGQGMMVGSGMQGSGSIKFHGANGTHIKDAILVARPEKPPMGSGALMAAEMKALHMAMAKLTPEQHVELMKMIRTYLESKGVPIPTLSEVKEVREEVKEVRKDAREDMKDMRKKALEAAKAKREETRAKLREVRGNGKVNVQDLSMMKDSGLSGGKATFKEFTVTK